MGQEVERVGMRYIHDGVANAPHATQKKLWRGAWILLQRVAWESASRYASTLWAMLVCQLVLPALLARRGADGAAQQQREVAALHPRWSAAAQFRAFACPIPSVTHLYTLKLP
jgi:hypothetical protein